MGMPNPSNLLEQVKGAMGITTDEPIIINEINDLIQAALFDLETNGVHAISMSTDPLIVQAVKTFCRAHFHSPADYDKLIAAYETQKGHLMIAKDYTNYGEAEAYGKG